MHQTKIEMQHPHHSTTQWNSNRDFSQLTICFSLRVPYLRVLHQDCSMEGSPLYKAGAPLGATDNVAQSSFEGLPTIISRALHTLAPGSPSSHAVTCKTQQKLPAFLGFLRRQGLSCSTHLQQWVRNGLGLRLAPIMLACASMGCYSTAADFVADPGLDGGLCRITHLARHACASALQRTRIRPHSIVSSLDGRHDISPGVSRLHISEQSRSC